MRTPKAGRVGLLDELMRDFERSVIEDHLRAHHGHVTETADALGITRRALDRKIDGYGLRELAGELRAAAGITGPRGG